MLKYILGNRLSLVQSDERVSPESCVVELYSFEEWEKNEKETGFFIPKDTDSLRFSRIDEYADYLYGAVAVPFEGSDIDDTRDFFFYVTRRELIFVENSDTAKRIIDRLAQFKVWQKPSVETLLYSFLEELIDNDLMRLEALEDMLTELEEEVLDKANEDFEREMMGIRKELLARNRYYTQLTVMAQELEENENGVLSADSERLFRLLGARTERLHGTTQMLRDYSMQIRDAYQTGIDANQNRIMKVLTIVTVIFMPLTLIAGWYGMNFKYMPELHCIYGYPLVFLASVLVVLFSIWWFKRNKYL